MKTILVVDDECSVVNILRKILTFTGYKVVTARDGIDALNLYEIHQNDIDLVLTDICMPNKNGNELIAELLLKNSELKIITMSGIVDSASISGWSVAHIQKPFNMHEVIEVVNVAFQQQ